MAFALPNREHLGPSLICRATNSVAVVPSQRCRTSAGLTWTFMRAGKVRTGIGGAFVSILDSRALTGGPAIGEGALRDEDGRAGPELLVSVWTIS